MKIASGVSLFVSVWTIWATAAESPVNPGDVQQRKWEQALQSGNLSEMNECADYFARQGILARVLLDSLNVISRTYRPDVLEVFLTRGIASDNERRTLGTAAAHLSQNPTWIPYLTKIGALAGPESADAYRMAIVSGNMESLRALIAAGVDVNRSSWAERGTPLHHAVLRRNIAAVEALLKAGANAHAHDDVFGTPIEMAVQLRSITALKLLDKEGKYEPLISTWTKEFPPAPKSRFLGEWTNDRDGFDTFNIRFNDDGTAMIGGGVIALPMMWRETTPNNSEAFAVVERGETDRTHPLIFKLGEDGDHLMMKRSSTQPVETLIRKK